VRAKVDTGLWWGNQREGGLVEDRGINGRIILKEMFKTWNGGHELD
jgi:hypothetical protein